MYIYYTIISKVVLFRFSKISIDFDIFKLIDLLGYFDVISITHAHAKAQHDRHVLSVQTMIGSAGTNDR